MTHDIFCILPFLSTHMLTGREVQSVTCLSTDESLTADPGVTSSIPPFRGD